MSTRTRRSSARMENDETIPKSPKEDDVGNTGRRKSKTSETSTLKKPQENIEGISDSVHQMHKLSEDTVPARRSPRGASRSASPQKQTKETRKVGGSGVSEEIDVSSDVTSVRRTNRARIPSTRLLDTQTDDVGSPVIKSRRNVKKNTDEVTKSIQNEKEIESTIEVEKVNVEPIMEELISMPSTSDYSITEGKTEDDNNRLTRRGRGRPPKTPRRDDVEADVPSPTPRVTRQRTISVASSGARTPHHDTGCVDSDNGTEPTGRSGRKRRKPTAYGDYVNVDEIVKKPNRNDSSMEDTISQPNTKQIIVNELIETQEVIDVKEHVEPIKYPTKSPIGQLSRSTTSQSSVRTRTRHARDEVLVDVVMDDVLDVVSGPLPLVPGRPPKPTPPPPMGRPFRAPPHSAPLLVAGPPRRNVAVVGHKNTAAPMLQTTVPGIRQSLKPNSSVSTHLPGPSNRSMAAPTKIPHKSVNHPLANLPTTSISSLHKPHREAELTTMKQSVNVEHVVHKETAVVGAVKMTKEQTQIDPLAAAMAELEGDARGVHDEGISSTARNAKAEKPVVRNATTDEALVFMTDRGKVTLEPVTVNMSDVDGSKEMFAIIDEDGAIIGYGDLDEDGNLIQEIDFNDLGENVEIIEQEIHYENGQPQVVEKSMTAASVKAQRSNQDTTESHPDEEGGDDDGPPELDPEEGAPADEVMFNEQQMSAHAHQVRYLDEADPELMEHETYIDGDGVEYIEDDGMAHQHHLDVRTVEFNFLDNKNICCGLCGEIVPYDLLVNEHLPQNHPELLGDGATDLEEIPYEVWLRDKLHFEKKAMESGFRTASFKEGSSMYNPHHHPRVTRKVSQVRVCPAEMSLQQLEDCLMKKMVEKLGRKVKVSLVDKLHAKCGECGSILSLNKKFEIMHLVRHFNAWHPTSHRCAGQWLTRVPQPGMGKPLNMQDFAVVDVTVDAVESLQCIWCGMFMGKDSLAMHFHEVHAEEIEVPKCRLCIEELVVNARLQEQFGEDFEVTMPDESHYQSGKIGSKYPSEEKLQKAIEKRIGGKGDDVLFDEVDSTRRHTTNSRMHYGKRSKPKRNFVMPSYRQAIPQNSPFIEALSSTQWQCRKCGFIIMAAVMSSGCISHYKKSHPEELDNVRYELCKARLERISDGCMEFVHASLIECLMCQVSFALHKPYNMCRAIRHLQKKHSEMMPENHTPAAIQHGYAKDIVLNTRKDREEEIEDLPGEPQQLSDEQLARFREEYKHLEFDEVRVLHMEDGEPVYLLVKEGEVLDQSMQNIITADHNSQPAHYTVGSNVDREMELLEAEKHMLHSGHVIRDGEEIYEVEEPLEEYDALEMPEGNSEVTKVSQNFEHIEQSDEELARQYDDDEAAPIPKEDGAVGRRLYSLEKYDEMQATETLRPEPVGYLRRAIQLDDEDQILEYFAPDEDAVLIDENMEIIEQEIVEHEEAIDTADTATPQDE